MKLDIVVSFGDTVLDVQRVEDPNELSRAITDQKLELGAGERTTIGKLTFDAKYAAADIALPKRKHRDFAYARLFMISVLTHAFFIAAAFITPASASMLADDLRKYRGTFVFDAEPKPEPKKPAAKAPKEEGRFGDKRSTLADAARSKHRNPRSGGASARAQDSGLLAMLRDTRGNIANVFERGGFGGGLNERMGGLQGSLFAEMGGAGGLGSRGTGPGAGGGNAIGIGALGTRGLGDGSGLPGLGRGHQSVTIPKREVVCGAGQDCGGLTKEEISRVIRRNIPRFRYCYEKQLNANPNLAGKVALSFTIAPTGAVAATSLKETTIGDENVESCVARVMQSLIFPKPRGGGIVVVTYPFVFQSNG